MYVCTVLFGTIESLWIRCKICMYVCECTDDHFSLVSTPSCSAPSEIAVVKYSKEILVRVLIATEVSIRPGHPSVHDRCSCHRVTIVRITCHIVRNFQATRLIAANGEAHTPINYFHYVHNIKAFTLQRKN